MSKKILVEKIRGFSDYTISSDGIVTSHKFGKTTVLSPSTTTGYEKVTLSNGKIKKNQQVHRLVAQAFLDKPKGKNIVNHIDGNKLNNALSNLEWTNHKGNSKHYSTKLAKKQGVVRKQKKEEDLKTRLSIVDFAYRACTNNPELFQSIYAANFGK